MSKELIRHNGEFYTIDRGNLEVELLEWDDDDYTIELMNGTRLRPSGKITRCLEQGEYTDDVELIGLSDPYEIKEITEVYTDWIIKMR